MTTRVAVIGAGHNGLVAAVLLARAGLEVTVLESADEAGGCLWTTSTDSGVRVERGAIDHGGAAEIAAELGLAEFGLDYLERDDLLGVAFGTGEVRRFAVDARATAATLGPDGDAYLELVRMADTFFGMLDVFPEPPTMTQLASTLSTLRGGDDTFRMLLSSAEAVLASRLSDPALRASLELYAAHGQVPPWSTGSGLFALLLPSSHGHRAVRPRGGSGSFAAALVAALQAAGGSLRCSSAVTGIRDAGRSRIVSTTTGDLEVDRVVSSIDVRRLATLVAEPSPALARAAASVTSGRFNISELTVSLASDSAVDLGPMGDSTAVWFSQERYGDLRSSFGRVVAGELPERPWSMVARGIQDEGTTGSSVWLSSIVPIAPERGEWTPDAEQRAADRVIASVSGVLGVDLAAQTSARWVSGPATWQHRLHGDGNPNHLDQTIDQLMGWRPVGLAGHRADVDWLYLAGSGTDPGGGLNGSSGRSVANALLDDLAGRHRRRSGGPVAELRGLWSAFRSYLVMRGGTP